MVLRGLGSGSALATPIAVLDRMIGVLALHRPDAQAWTASEIGLAEAVARELGMGVHTARLLRENSMRLAQQGALLQAAQVVTGELHVDTVLQLLVDQVAQLLDADAADCYLFTPDRGSLRCAAVHGLDPEVIGCEFSADRGLAGVALEERRVVLAGGPRRRPRRCCPTRRIGASRPRRSHPWSRTGLARRPRRQRPRLEPHLRRLRARGALDLRHSCVARPPERGEL